MRCSIKNIKLPPAPAATKPQRVADPREDAALLRAVRKEQLIRKAQEDIRKSETVQDKKRPRVITTLDKEQRAQAIEMWNEGKLVKEIAETMAVNESTLYGIFERMQKQGLIEPRVQYKKVDKEKVLEELKAGKPAHRIAKEMGVHHKTIQRWRNIFKKEGKL